MSYLKSLTHVTPKSLTCVTPKSLTRVTLYKVTRHHHVPNCNMKVRNKSVHLKKFLAIFKLNPLIFNIKKMKVRFLF